MFNIKNIVNKITDRGKDSQPNSPGRVQGDDILSKQVAEGFLCPKCMKAFPSQEDLQRHYVSTHDGGSADQNEGFLCPKCMKPHSCSDELEEHYLTTHGAEADDIPLPWEETEHRKQQQEGSLAAPEKVDVQAVTDVNELKRLLTEALEHKTTLLQEKERLEQRAAQLARDNVTLKAASDETEGNQVALKERLKVVEAQLAHRESIDDAAVLRQELVQVQRVMDELTREKERERDELKAQLQQLQDLHAAKKLSDNTNKDVHELHRKLEECEMQLQQKDATIRDLEISMESQKSHITEAEKKIKEKISELGTLKQELGFVNDSLQQQQRLNEVLQTRVTELNLLEEQVEEFKSLYDSTRKVVEEKNEEVKSSQARLDALNKQKDILKSELQHKTKLCEELERSNSGYLKELTQKKEEITRLELERSELLVQIEAGEGANTAIQQLSQEKILLVNQLKEWTESHSKRVQELERSITEVRELKDRNEELMQQLGSIRNQLKEAEDKLVLVTQELKKKNTEAQDLMMERTACTERNDSLESALTKNSRLLNEAAEKVNVLNEALEQCRTKLSDLESKNSKMEGKVKEKEMEMNKLHADVSNLETRLADSMSEVKELQAELNTEKSNNVKLQEERNAAANDVTRLNNILSQKEKTVATLETQNLEVQKSLQEVNCEKQKIEEEGKKELEVYKGLLNESKLSIAEHEKGKEALLNENKVLAENIKELEESLANTKESIKEKEQHLGKETSEKEALKKELALERNKCTQLQEEKVSFECELEKKVDDLKKVHASLDEVAGEKLALEAQLAASQSEQQALLERCYASSAESENQRKNNADLRRRLEESQAALHELGRENQTLQLELEKLVGRKWTEDSDAVSCTLCQKEFSIIVRKHHCRNCGQIFCNECSSKMAPLQTNKKPVRVCDSCYNELGNK